MPITIRALTTIEECRRVAELERTVWAYTDSEDVVPPPVLIVSARRGGILLGAFDGSELVGFVYSMPSLKDGRLAQWSHMLGVVPAARESGLGLRLKLAQREWAMQMGIDLIEWTVDPLQAVNAHLNFARLGVVVEEYEENAYGTSSSPLHAGPPTDRFIAQWRIGTPHVERRVSAPGDVRIRDASVAAAVLVNPSIDAGGWLEPGRRTLDADADRLLVEIPSAFTSMLERRPDLAMAWRLATREIFQTYLARGYRVVDFILARAHQRGHYLMTRKPE